MAKYYIIDKIKLEDLPDYLKRYCLTVERVDRWQRRGWLVWTERSNTWQAGSVSPAGDERLSLASPAS